MVYNALQTPSVFIPQARDSSHLTPKLFSINQSVLKSLCDPSTRFPEPSHQSEAVRIAKTSSCLHQHPPSTFRTLRSSRLSLPNTTIGNGIIVQTLWPTGSTPAGRKRVTRSPDRPSTRSSRPMGGSRSWDWAMTKRVSFKDKDETQAYGCGDVKR